MPDPILDISTLAPERELVRIRTEEDPEGELYELATADDLSLRDQQWLHTRGQRIMDLLEKKGRLTKNESDELELAIDRLLGIAVPSLPDEVKARLSVLQKTKLMEAFTQASPELAKVAAEVRSSTGASSSPAFSDSTEGTQTGGST